MFVNNVLSYPANRDTNEDNNSTSLAGVIKNGRNRGIEQKCSDVV